MAKLYYGGGKCSIKGKVRGVHIRFNGKVEIKDMTSDSFVLIYQNNGIMIFPIGKGLLNELFTYRGKIKIMTVEAVNEQGEKIPATITKEMDFPELMGKPENITVKPENLNAGHSTGDTFRKTVLVKKYLNNLKTGNLELYFKNGDKYEGDYHIELKNNTAFTGKTHDRDSVALYYKSREELISTKNDKLIPPSTIERDVKKSFRQRRRR